MVEDQKLLIESKASQKFSRTSLDSNSNEMSPNVSPNIEAINNDKSSKME